MVNEQRSREFKSFLSEIPVNHLRIVLAQEQASGISDPIAWSVLEACNVALVASGTATLETALFKNQW